MLKEAKYSRTILTRKAKLGGCQLGNYNGINVSGNISNGSSRISVSYVIGSLLDRRSRDNRNALSTFNGCANQKGKNSGQDG